MRLANLIENAPFNLERALNSTVKMLFSAAGNDHPHAVEVRDDFNGFVTKYENHRKPDLKYKLIPGYHPGTSYYLFKEENDADDFVHGLNIELRQSPGNASHVQVQKFSLAPQILVSRYSEAQKEELKQSIRGLYNQAAQPVPENLDDVIKTGIDAIMALELPPGRLIDRKVLNGYRDRVAGVEILEYVEAKLKGQEYEP